MHALAILPLLTFVVCIGGLAVRRLGRPVRLGDRSYPSVDRFIEQFGAELGLEGKRVAESPWISRLSDARFAGTSQSGLGARLTFSTKDADGNDLPHSNAVFAVDCEKVPQITVTVKGFLDRIKTAAGITSSLTTGERAFDDRYVVATLEPGRAQVELSKPAFREAIESVFAHYKLAQLELARGEIVAHVPVKDLAPEHYARLFKRLGVLARTIDSIIVKVQAGDSSHAKCGFCHEGFAVDAPDLVSCELCSTITHKACRAELGRCPIAGCAGEIKEHARVRA